MPNEQTSVPLYAASEVLTAANMNISAGTGVPVFATTVTRDAAFGGAGEKVLAEGQLCYLSATNVVQYYDGAAWATVGPAVAAASGLTLISTTTIGTTVSTVTISSAFSATYDNYKIIVSGGALSSNENLALQLGATTTGYYAGATNISYGGVVTGVGDSNAASWTRFGGGSTNGLIGSADIFMPFAAKNTLIIFAKAIPITTQNAQLSAGFLDNTTSYTAFTINVSGGATMTGGTIKVYGYQNS